MYLPDTAVLITRFITEAGVGEVVDFMPPTSDQATDNHRIVRMIRCVRGEMSFEIDIAPRSMSGCPMCGLTGVTYRFQSA
jgi:hypothetical protein